MFAQRNIIGLPPVDMFLTVETGRVIWGRRRWIEEKPCIRKLSKSAEIREGQSSVIVHPLMTAQSASISDSSLL
jgi:hypothetical protein